MDDRLYRSRTDRMLTGVAGGLAERLDVDPSLVRVVWAVSMPLTGFVTLLIYIVMALVVPDEPYPSAGGAFAGAGPAWPPRPDPFAGSEPTGAGGARAGEAPTEGPANGAGGGPSAGSGGVPSGGPSAGWAGAWPNERSARRAERRAARAEWRAAHPGGGGAIVLGLILVGLGVLFLAQQIVPAFDWDLAWPVVAIVLGLILVVGSFRRG